MNDHQSQRLLDALSEPSRAALLEGFRVRRLVQGEILGGPQEIRDSVFILRSGRIRVFLTFEDKEQTLTFLEPGDIYSTHSRAYLQAISECDVLVTETRTMLGKLAALPEAAPVVIRVLAQSLGNAMQIIEDLAFRGNSGTARSCRRLRRCGAGCARRSGGCSGRNRCRAGRPHRRCCDRWSWCRWCSCCLRKWGPPSRESGRWKAILGSRRGAVCQPADSAFFSCARQLL